MIYNDGTLMQQSFAVVRTAECTWAFRSASTSRTSLRLISLRTPPRFGATSSDVVKYGLSQIGVKLGMAILAILASLTFRCSLLSDPTLREAFPICLYIFGLPLDCSIVVLTEVTGR